MTDINIPNSGGGADAVTAIGSRVFFSADDGVHGGEPWYIDLGPVIRIPRPPSAVLGTQSTMSPSGGHSSKYDVSEEEVDVLIQLVSR
jgi:hypothetical protein